MESIQKAKLKFERHKQDIERLQLLPAGWSPFVSKQGYIELVIWVGFFFFKWEADVKKWFWLLGLVFLICLVMQTEVVAWARMQDQSQFKLH